MSSCTFLLFFCLLTPNPKYVTLLQECYKKTLSVQEYERERSKTELTKVELKKSHELILKILFINEASIFFNFPHMQFCDLSPSYSPNFHYFHK